MSGDLARIERRLTTIDAVGTVVDAMHALARAQLPEADAAAAAATRYVDELDEIIARLAGAPSHPPESSLAIIIGPERPLCGGLPRSVARLAAAERGPIALVGTRMAEAHALLDANEPVFVCPGPTSAIDLDENAIELAQLILEHAQGREVELVHPLPQRHEAHRSLLLGGLRVLEEEPPETLTPVTDVLAHAVREVTRARLRVALAEALRVEVAARLAAAEAARHAVDERRDTLRTQWRVARHEAITSEILELVTGRAALDDV